MPDSPKLKALFIKRQFASLYSISPVEVDKMKTSDISGLMIIENLIIEKAKMDKPIMK